MQGKLYSDSSSLYEDEARILYDYFSSAADRIIEEEDNANAVIEQKDNELTETRIKLKKKKSKNTIIAILLAVATIAIGAGMMFFQNSPLMEVVYELVGGLAITLVVILIGHGQVKKIEKARTALENELEKANQDFKDIRRDYKVNKLGVAYVPIAKKVPFGTQNVTIDMSGAVNDETFELITMNDPAKFESDVNNLKEKLSSIPFVEGGKFTQNVDTADYSVSMQEVPVYDYISGIDQEIDKIDRDLNNINSTKVSLPLIAPESEGMKFMNECGTTEPEEYPVVDVFSEEGIQPKLDVLFNIYNDRKKNANTGDEKALESLISFIGITSQAIAGSKMNCCQAILEYNNGLFANVLKSPYRNYSPKLEAETLEEIKQMNFNFADMSETYRPFKFKESSLMKFDLYSNSWIDDTGARSSMPFGLHQLQDEIFMPIISNLMEENRIERRKIYEKIQEQKLNYLNKWHTETQDFYGRNRDAADTLKSSIIESLAKYNSSYSTWKAISDTIKKMDAQQKLMSGKTESNQDDKAAMVVSAETVNSNFKKLEEEFDAYMDRLQDDIDEKADRFGKITYFEAYLYASEAQKSALASSHLKDFDARQLKIARINPYLAEYGEFPPQPRVEDSVYNLMDLDLTKEAEKILTNLSEESIPEEEETEPEEEPVEEIPEEEEVPEEDHDENVEEDEEEDEEPESNLDDNEVDEEEEEYYESDEDETEEEDSSLDIAYLTPSSSDIIDDDDDDDSDDDDDDLKGI